MAVSRQEAFAVWYTYNLSLFGVVCIKQVCKSTRDLIIALSKVAPSGIDMYFENVGGMHFEAAMKCLRPNGRVAVCGVISDYNNPKMSPNKIYISNMIYTAQRIEGFHCFPWLFGQRGNFLQDMAKWVDEGKVKVEERLGLWATCSS